MTRAERRHRRSRAIARRMTVVREVWRYPIGRWTLADTEPGRLAKWNLKCTCRHCKKPRYSRAAHSQSPRSNP